MVFGRSIPNQMEWHRVFAWLPVRTLDQRWAWLETVDRISYYSHKVPIDAARGWHLSWCYRVIE